MQLTTDGLVLKEQDIGENDLLVTVLTRKEGVIRAFVKNAKNGKKTSAAASRTLCYSRFEIYKGREKYIINHTEPIQVFFELRQDLEKLSLAQYFADIAIHVIPDGSDSEPYLRLMLNCLHFLIKKDYNPLQVKAIYEMRILSMAGYMPDLVCCSECHTYEKELMYFSVKQGKLFCDDCYKNHSEMAVAVQKGVLTALRHTIYAEFGKLFSFSLSDTGIKSLSQISEKYMISQLERSFKSLEFYHQIM